MLAARVLVKDDKQFMHHLEQKHSDFVLPFVIEQFKYMDPFDKKYLKVIKGDYIQHIHLTGGKLVGQGKRRKDQIDLFYNKKTINTPPIYIKGEYINGFY